MKAFPVHWPLVIPSRPCYGARSKQSLCNPILIQHQTTTTNKTTNDEVKGHKNSRKRGHITQCHCKCRMRHWRLAFCLLSKLDTPFYFFNWSILWYPQRLDQFASQQKKKMESNSDAGRLWSWTRNGNKRIRYPQQYRKCWSLKHSREPTINTVYQVSRGLHSKTVGIAGILHSTGANNSSSREWKPPDSNGFLSVHHPAKKTKTNSWMNINTTSVSGMFVDL